MNYKGVFLSLVNFLITSIIFTGLFYLPSFLVKADIVKVVTEYLPPFQIRMIDGSLSGYGTEVIAELFKITGDTPDVQVLPWARAYANARKKPNVLRNSRKSVQTLIFYFFIEIGFEKTN